MATRKPKQEEKSSTRATGRKPAGPATGEVYQLKITLSAIRPPIWRRLQVKDCSLAKLHTIIQAGFGWTDSHLHVFEINGVQYGDPEQWGDASGWGDPEVGNERKVKLSQLAAQGIKKFAYVYDMGDNWEHVIQIEKALPSEPGVKYPRCVDGARAGPPEDCGGPWGYPGFLEAIQDPKHPEHEDMLEWSGGAFDPEAFDPEGVNKELR